MSLWNFFNHGGHSRSSLPSQASHFRYRSRDSLDSDHQSNSSSSDDSEFMVPRANKFASFPRHLGLTRQLKWPVADLNNNTNSKNCLPFVTSMKSSSMSSNAPPTATSTTSTESSCTVECTDGTCDCTLVPTHIEQHQVSSATSHTDLHSSAATATSSASPSREPTVQSQFIQSLQRTIHSFKSESGPGTDLMPSSPELLSSLLVQVQVVHSESDGQRFADQLRLPAQFACSIERSQSTLVALEAMHLTYLSAIEQNQQKFDSLPDLDRLIAAFNPNRLQLWLKASLSRHDISEQPLEQYFHIAHYRTLLQKPILWVDGNSSIVTPYQLAHLVNAQSECDQPEFKVSNSTFVEHLSSHAQLNFLDPATQPVLNLQLFLSDAFGAKMTTGTFVLVYGPEEFPSQFDAVSPTSKNIFTFQADVHVNPDAATIDSGFGPNSGSSDECSSDSALGSRGSPDSEPITPANFDVVSSQSQLSSESSGSVQDDYEDCIDLLTPTPEEGENLENEAQESNVTPTSGRKFFFFGPRKQSKGQTVRKTKQLDKERKDKKNSVSSSCSGLTGSPAPNKRKSVRSSSLHSIDAELSCSARSMDTIVGSAATSMTELNSGKRSNSSSVVSRKKFSDVLQTLSLSNLFMRRSASATSIVKPCQPSNWEESSIYIDGTASLYLSFEARIELEKLTRGTQEVAVDVDEVDQTGPMINAVPNCYPDTSIQLDSVNYLQDIDSLPKLKNADNDGNLFGNEVRPGREPRPSGLPAAIEVLLRAFLQQDGLRHEGVLRKSLHQRYGRVERYLLNVINDFELLQLNQTRVCCIEKALADISVEYHACILKDYLRKLSQPLLSFEIYPELQSIAEELQRAHQTEQPEEVAQQNAINSIRDLLFRAAELDGSECLERPRLILLWYVLALCHQICKHCTATRMDSSATAVCISQSLFFNGANQLLGSDGDLKSSKEESEKKRSYSNFSLFSGRSRQNRPSTSSSISAADGMEYSEPKSVRSAQSIGCMTGLCGGLNDIPLATLLTQFFIENCDQIFTGLRLAGWKDGQEEVVCPSEIIFRLADNCEPMQQNLENEDRISFWSDLALMDLEDDVFDGECSQRSGSQCSANLIAEFDKVIQEQAAEEISNPKRSNSIDRRVEEVRMSIMDFINSEMIDHTLMDIDVLDSATTVQPTSILKRSTTRSSRRASKRKSTRRQRHLLSGAKQATEVVSSSALAQMAESYETKRKSIDGTIARIARRLSELKATKGSTTRSASQPEVVLNSALADPTLTTESQPIFIPTNRHSICLEQNPSAATNHVFIPEPDYSEHEHEHFPSMDPVIGDDGDDVQETENPLQKNNPDEEVDEDFGFRRKFTEELKKREIEAELKRYKTKNKAKSKHKSKSKTSSGTLFKKISNFLNRSRDEEELNSDLENIEQQPSTFYVLPSAEPIGADTSKHVLSSTSLGKYVVTKPKEECSEWEYLHWPARYQPINASPRPPRSHTFTAGTDEPTSSSSASSSEPHSTKSTITSRKHKKSRFQVGQLMERCKRTFSTRSSSSFTPGDLDNSCSEIQLLTSKQIDQPQDQSKVSITGYRFSDNFSSTSSNDSRASPLSARTINRTWPSGPSASGLRSSPIPQFAVNSVSSAEQGRVPEKEKFHVYL